MILHFSHIGLTDGRTFMVPFGWIQTGWLWWPGFGHRYHPRNGANPPRTDASRASKRDSAG
jgi:hypothetical protein